MKTLNEMTIMQKVKIIHIWFPSEIPNLLTYLENHLTAYQLEKPEMLCRWVAGSYTAEEERKYLQDAVSQIQQNNAELCQNRNLFAELLFNRFLICYTGYSLIEYAKTRQYDNRGFFLAVDLFFDVSITS